MDKILIIEDEESILTFLKPELQHEGYFVDTAMDGETGLEKLEQESADLVLLDMMLPHLNGLAVLRRIRNFSDVPVIILTARGQTMDKVLGLDSGADDYLTKPFEIEELLARIRSTLRRQKKGAGDTLKFSDITMNVPSRRVSVGDENIEFTAKEFDLLCYMMQNANHTLTRDQILNSVWGYDFFGDSKVVDVYIRYLRNKLDDRFSKNYITTIRGVGYVMRDEI